METITKVIAVGPKKAMPSIPETTTVILNNIKSAIG